MTKEEYLISLELALVNAGISNADEIVDKYRKRFELAALADMSVDEAIKMMGSVESVVKKYIDNENVEYYDVYTFKLEDALASNIVIKKGTKPGIVINVDEELLDKLNIQHQDNKLSITDKFGKSFFRRCRGSILIEIGDNIKFDKFEISTVSCDVEVCAINTIKTSFYTVSGDFDIDKIIAEDVLLNSVSGDFNVSRIKTNEIRINTVSGDVEVSYIEADKAIFDTISGDINVCGKLKLKRGSSITGSINYKAVN
ncbi:MAG: hypothetical protein E7183_06070 [Erysipelotrichaceae bacterium]|nr:hypothetical protein [Erysipelotrichaceae bacterium]